MMMTMAGIQEARRIAKGAPTRLMSELTGAFAIGQFAGPILVSISKSPDQALGHAKALRCGGSSCQRLRPLAQTVRHTAPNAAFQ